VSCVIRDLPTRASGACSRTIPSRRLCGDGRLRSGEPPIGGGTFRDRAEFWNSILEVRPAAFWYWRISMNILGAGLLWVTCIPRFCRLSVVSLM